MPKKNSQGSTPEKHWVSIAIAVIGVLGSVAVALVNRSEVKSETKETVASSLETRFKNLQGIHVQSGTVEGINSLSDWKLDSAPPRTRLRETSPPRIWDKRVTFAQSFSATPTVVTGIRALDASNQANTRVIVFTGDVDPSGFTLRIQTWSDSKIYDIMVDWLAYQQ